MRLSTGRAYVLTVTTLAGFLVSSLAHGDALGPPQTAVPTVPESSVLTGASDTFEQRDINPYDCGKKGCVECCVPCCTDCCDDPCATWTVSAGALFLNRSDPSDSLLFFNPTFPTQTMNASNFDFGWQTGYEIGVTRHRLFGDTDVEAKFFQVDSWTDTVNASFSGPDTVIGTMSPTHITGARNVTSTYGSELLSLELNLRRRSAILPRWRWIAGFRMLELDEDLNSVMSKPGSSSAAAWDVGTRNRLYGLQLGGELEMLSNCNLCVRGFAKAGIYGNEANDSVTFSCLADPKCEPFFGDTNKSRAAFVGETGLSARYCFCDSWALRVDYRFMWVDGVALASNQLAANQRLTVPPFPPNGQRIFTGADTTDGVFYHGAFVGLECRF